jgi:hypothetical protein
MIAVPVIALVVENMAKTVSVVMSASSPSRNAASARLQYRTTGNHRGFAIVRER